MIYFFLAVIFIQQLMHEYKIARIKEELHLFFHSITTIGKTTDTVIEMWIEHKKMHDQQ